MLDYKVVSLVEDKLGEVQDQRINTSFNNPATMFYSSSHAPYTLPPL